MTDTLKRTRLAPLQEDQGARFVPFGGWELPVMYTSIVEEADAVRNHCGMFDVSHMGRLFVSGEKALASLDSILSRDLTSLAVGRQRYSLLLNEEGGILDDLMVARIAEEEFLLVVNANNLSGDFIWLDRHLDPECPLTDRSESTLMIALQGPESEQHLSGLVGQDLSQMRFLHVMEGQFEDAPVLMCRSGYTGEDGFEIILPIEAGLVLWTSLSERGVKACGLGARDLLRLEVGYSLHGHELSPATMPTECGLEWALSKKNPYIGRQAILDNPPRTELIGFICEQKAIPRAEFPVAVDGEEVGHVTSGGLSSRLPNGFGLARVRKDSVGENLEVLIRGKSIPAKRAKVPFIPDRVKR